MNLHNKIKIIILIFTLSLGCSDSQPMDDDSTVVVDDKENNGTTDNPLNNTEEPGSVVLYGKKLLDHPRLLFTEEEKDLVLSKMKNDELLSDLISLLKLKAEEQLVLATIPYPEGGDLLDISREHLYRIITLSMAYRIFNEKKYGYKAIEHLLNVCNYPDWNPSHFLDVAEMTTAVAIGYDWLYEILNESQRAKISKEIRDKAINLALKEYASPEVNSWSTRETNWNVVCNSGISIAALAIAEDLRDNKNRLETIINHASRYMPNCLTLFRPDGVCYEGPAYLEYTINYFSLLSKTLTDNIGSDRGLSDIPGMQNVANYYVGTLSPTKKVFNFADSWSTRPSLSPWFFHYSKQYDQPYIATFYREEIKDIINGKADFPKSIFFLSIAWYDDRTKNDNSVNTKLKVFDNHHNPIAVFNGNNPDVNSLYMITKGGDPDMAHQQLDVGTFVLENQGVRWFDDLGADLYSLAGFWERYPTGRRWKYFRTSNFSHNVPFIDGKIQSSMGEGTIDKFNSEVDEPFVILNLGTVYSLQPTSVKRGFKMLGNSVMLIQDEFLLESSGQKVTESFITGANIIIENNIATLDKGGKKFYLRVVKPSNIVMEENIAEAFTAGEARVSGYKLLRISSPATTSNEKVIFKILLCSDLNRITATVPEDKILSEWN